MPIETYSSPLLGVLVTLGNLVVWLGLAAALACVGLYWMAMIRTMRRPADPPAVPAPNGNGKKNGAGRARADATQGSTPPDRKTERIGLWARRAFYLTGACAAVAGVCLMTLILTQTYAVAYVWKNSSKALPFGYRFASFWSDQEGTFILWALYNTIIGLVFLWKARQDERWVMPFFTLINVSLFLLLTFMNPFWMHNLTDVRTELEKLASSPEDLSFLPAAKSGWHYVQYYLGWGTYPKLINGKGLNEQLQNFWMVIHPPTLFVGYSTMILPGCFALGALMRRDYDSWVNRAAPWLTFSWAILGTGIFLGAYWAYETLGWGGYWSWDPVENSSILPWLVGTALIHGLLGQRARGNFKQANLFLGVMTAATVLLSSFLVRSGVLGEISVHSFATPQKSVFMTLLGILILWTVMGVGIWLWRYRDIQSEIAYESMWERHFGFFLGLIVLSASAIVVAFGVFFIPVLLPLITQKKSSVDYTFYNKALLPVAYVMVLLMTLTPLMPWRQARENPRPMRPFNIAVLALSALITLFFLCAAVWAWMGGFQNQNDPAYVAFGLALALGLVTNGLCLIRATRGGFLSAGPWIAHVGFLLMLAGIVTTSRFNKTYPLDGPARVQVGESIQVLGREFTFRGTRSASDRPGDKDRMLFDLTRDGKTTRLEPKYFLTRQGEEMKPMAWPSIVNEWFGGLWGDLYLVPNFLDQAGVTPLANVKKNEPATAAVRFREDGPEDVVQLTFTGLDTSEMQEVLQQQDPHSGGELKPFVVYANVRLSVNGVAKSYRPGLRITPDDGRQSLPVTVEGLRQGTGYELVFRGTNLNPSDLQATFELVPEEPVPVAYFQVLYVPGIQLLWFACYLMFAGAFICYVRRARLARRPVPAKGAEPAPSRRKDRAPEPEPARTE